MAHSLRQVAAANRETARAEKLSNWSVYLLYRHPGTVLAWLLLKTRLSPTNVSVIGLGVAGLMPLVAGLLPIGAAGIVLFWLAVLFQILDCSDGAMARAGGTGSAAGARYDFLIDMFQWGVLYASMGLLVQRRGPRKDHRAGGGEPAIGQLDVVSQWSERADPPVVAFGALHVCGRYRGAGLQHRRRSGCLEPGC